MDLTLKQKLVGIAVSASAALIGLGLFARHQAERVIAAYEPIAHDSLPSTRLLGDLLYRFRQIRVEVRSIPIRGNGPERALAYVAAAKAAVAATDESMAAVKEFVRGDAEAEAYARMEKSLAEFKAFGGEVFAMAESKDPQAVDRIADAIRDVCPRKTAPFESAIQDLVRIQSENAAARVRAAKSEARSTNTLILFGSLVSAFALLLLSTGVATALARRLAAATSGVGAASGSVDASVGQVAAASSEVTSAVSRQAAAIHETSAALEQVLAMVTKSAEKAAEILSAAEGSKAHAGRGGATVDRMLAALNGLKASNETSAAELKDSNEKVSRILGVMADVSAKTRVINDIVFQTKLLSFNASVEAARAGEHGKGFAVVAEEIGNLARMSGQAAQEINSLLEQSTRQVTETIEENRARVEKMLSNSSELLGGSVSISQECREALEKILEASARVTGMVEEISGSSRESAHGVNEITKALHDIDRSSRDTAHAAETCRSSSTALAEEAKRLKAVAAELGNSVHGRQWSESPAGLHNRQEPLKAA